MPLGIFVIVNIFNIDFYIIFQGNKIKCNAMYLSFHTLFQILIASIMCSYQKEDWENLAAQAEVSSEIHSRILPFFEIMS